MCFCPLLAVGGMACPLAGFLLLNWVHELENTNLSPFLRDVDGETGMFLESKQKAERALQDKSPVYIHSCAGSCTGISGPGQ